MFTTCFMFTAAQIEQQIQQLEGVRVTIKSPAHVRFAVSYRSAYPRRLGVDATVHQLIERITTFTSKHSVTLH